MPDMNMRTFEELQRHQLVTKFGIQSQSELEDYQVKLDNVDNPTQAQDNLIVDNNGKSLPHWNESLDFDTWVKMNIGISGKRGLLIHGNSGLSTVSSISKTMLAGSEFDDLTGWTQQSGTWTAGATLTSTADAFLRHTEELPVSSDFIIEMRAKTGDNFYPAIIAKGDSTISTSVGYNTWGYSYTPLTPRFRVDNVILDAGNTQLSDFTWYRLIAKLHLTVGNNIVEMYSDTGTFIDSAETSTDSTNTEDYFGIYNLVDNDMEIDWIFVRKHTPTEPNIQISTPKNISTALKLFGRAG